MSPRAGPREGRRQARRHLGLRRRAVGDAHRPPALRGRDALRHPGRRPEDGPRSRRASRGRPAPGPPPPRTLPARRTRSSGCTTSPTRGSSWRRKRSAAPAVARCRPTAAGGRSTSPGRWRRSRSRPPRRGRSSGTPGAGHGARAEAGGASSHPARCPRGPSTSRPTGDGSPSRPPARTARRGSTSGSSTSLEPKALPGTEGGDAPFFSPDGRSVGFFAEKKLKRVDLAGGPARELADAPDHRGGSWGSQNTIVFAPEGGGPIFRVPASGGDATPVTALDPGTQETSHRWPRFLPDGKRFLFMSRKPKSPGPARGRGGIRRRGPADPSRRVQHRGRHRPRPALLRARDDAPRAGLRQPDAHGLRRPGRRWPRASGAT